MGGDFFGESVPVKWVSHLCGSDFFSACGGLFMFFTCFFNIKQEIFAPAAGGPSVPLKWVKKSPPKTVSVPVKWVSHLKREYTVSCIR